MIFKPHHLSYKQTGAFSQIVNDYLNGDDQLRPFYAHPVDIEGVKNAILCRDKFNTDRKLLHEQLINQYNSINASEKVIANIDLLLKDNTYTITTAHQPNIFTGHLYFIYKIIHAVKLADELNKKLSGNNFVPVYYMGSEDADLDELGKITVEGKNYKWLTTQKGAVGRMKVDDAFIRLIDELNSQLSVNEYGIEIMEMIRNSYKKEATIEESTFHFVNSLFGTYGLIVLLPDNKKLKASFIDIVTKELKDNFSSQSVAATIQEFPEQYKIQASGREINLFYLKDDIRQRIEKNGNGYKVTGTGITFTEEEMLKEIKDFPERISANVILRPLYQEMILPDVAFIGGGGELAYWLELKKVFAIADIPYPVLVLRNSFMIIAKKISEKINNLGFTAGDIFRESDSLLDELVKKHSTNKLDLLEESKMVGRAYDLMENTVSAIDPTLGRHIKSLSAKSIQRIHIAEKKMMRAEKKKFEAQERQVKKIKDSLFPAGALQERIDNFLPYYAVWGKNFISALYEHSGGLEQKFVILTET